MGAAVVCRRRVVNLFEKLNLIAGRLGVAAGRLDDFECAMPLLSDEHRVSACNTRS